MKRNIFAYFYLPLAIISVTHGTSSLCMSPTTEAARIVGAGLCATTCVLSSVLLALHIGNVRRSRTEYLEGRSPHNSILGVIYGSLPGVCSIAGSCLAISSGFFAHKLIKPLLSSPAPRCVTLLGAGAAAAVAAYSYAGAAFYGASAYKSLRDEDPFQRKHAVTGAILSGASALGGTACGAIARSLFRESMRR